jgi:single-strand DNA-binding protein
MNINRVVLTGNLTTDPELRSLPSGTAVCKLRVACNTRRKADGEWVDKPNYFDIVAFGGQADACARYLAKGSPVAIDGRLEWREWETDAGSKRQAVSIITDNIQFLRSKDSSDSNSASPEDGELLPAGVGAGEGDDIPF